MGKVFVEGSSTSVELILLLKSNKNTPLFPVIQFTPQNFPLSWLTIVSLHIYTYTITIVSTEGKLSSHSERTGHTHGLYL
jgi:hypothetical protein